MTRPLPPEQSRIYRPESIVEPLPISKLFPSPGPLEVELGAGDGSFLAAYAAAHRDTNFIGVERLLGRLRKIDRKAHRAGLSNICLVRIEANYLVNYLLPPDAVQAVHIYFPDPWPKRRHWKNRLITPAFTELLRAVLEHGGHVHLRTDDQNYFEQMLQSFGGNSNFEKVPTPPALLEFTTDFERGFAKRGISTNAATYRRIP